ncbi:UDP-glycosyltransferase UGT5-like isoform X2 [Anastrepha obliqua]|uniref:UDP-glycosyltransferase UGT5-like isoform X2 n=1 Tax=Anastrepha obliqua TaxID=95512 RepID=UPI002409A72D|nr:UDP-glycosyltransferase UGT5-like isoform X2 [Anastrepha obliqua]
MFSTKLNILIITTLACSTLHSPQSVDAASARILGLFTSFSKSHMLIYCSVAEELARVGHDVTVIGMTKNVYPNATYKYIQLQLPNGGQVDGKALRSVVNSRQSFIQSMLVTTRESMRMANETLWEPRMRAFLHDNHAGAFDLLLFGFVMNEFQMGIAAHFQCPIVILWVIQPALQINRFVGNPDVVDYVPTLFSHLKQPMGFLQRVKNYITALVEDLLCVYLDQRAQQLYDYNFPPDRYPPLDEVRKNVSLVFVNHHFSQGPIRPNVPNLIEIGGIQIKEKPDPLPADIGKVLDEAKEGVIYFSLGTNIQSTHLTEEKAKIMFNVISKLPYKVLWKWGDSDRPGQSNNIIYKDWLPQDDILAHPNIKLFITHGGMGSVVEAQYHGVPMVGIPLFGDQPSNMANVERSGYGLSVDYITLSEESLNKAIQEVLHNPKYTKTVRDFSRLYRDRPMSPRETVVYWVEYVLRHNGAKHMQSPAVHMNRWQLMSLDVIGFLLAIFGCVVAVFVKICMLLCCRRKTKTAKVTKVKVKKAKKNE